MSDDWRRRAGCGDETDLFNTTFEQKYPAGEKDTRATRNARAVCSRCPVAQDCLWWALETGQQWGVWGGMTPPERDQMAASRKVVRQPQLSADDFSPEMRLAAALDKATADGEPLGPVFAAFGVHHDNATLWRKGFAARLSGSDPSVTSAKMKAS